MRVLSNRSQMTSTGGKKQRRGTRAAAECVTDALTTFWRHRWSITKQTHGNIEFIRFIQWTEKRKRHTCLVPFDRSRICASLDIFKSSLLLFFFFILCTVSPKRFSTPSLAKSRIIAKTVSKLRVSRSDKTRWQLLWGFLSVYTFSSGQELSFSLFLRFSFW